MGMNSSAAGQDVFDVANWLDRANRRTGAGSSGGESAAPPASYVPRHRADVAVDSVA